MPFHVQTIVNGSLEQNCYFLGEQGGNEGILVDPGSSPQTLLRALDQNGHRPRLILATHGHFDHIGAVQDLAEHFHCPFAMSRKDEGLLDVLEDTFAFYGMGSTRRPKVDRWLDASSLVEAAGLRIMVLETPGHTPGGLCFWHPESRSLFSGDTLFAGSVGRSDFEGSSHEQLIAGIRRELLPLADPVDLFPGHGEASTLAQERLHNPFLA
jgi:glyoxylase-like metal-dependent hydrolase (beta-lactamase superfamily II)